MDRFRRFDQQIDAQSVDTRHGGNSLAFVGTFDNEVGLNQHAG